MTSCDRRGRCHQLQEGRNRESGAAAHLVWQLGRHAASSHKLKLTLRVTAIRCVQSFPLCTSIELISLDRCCWLCHAIADCVLLSPGTHACAPHQAEPSQTRTSRRTETDGGPALSLQGAPASDLTLESGRTRCGGPVATCITHTVHIRPDWRMLEGMCGEGGCAAINSVCAGRLAERMSGDKHGHSWARERPGGACAQPCGISTGGADMLGPRHMSGTNTGRHWALRACSRFFPSRGNRGCHGVSGPFMRQKIQQTPRKLPVPPLQSLHALRTRQKLPPGTPQVRQIKGKVTSLSEFHPYSPRVCIQHH